MKINFVSLIATLFLLAILNACSSTIEKPVTDSSEQAKLPVNDFPTQDRVEFVLECVAQHGGEFRYEVVYPCICSMDKLASKMTYKEYNEAKTFTYLRSTPGEKGGIFRDPPQAKKLRKKLKEAKKYAEESCFVKM